MDTITIAGRRFKPARDTTAENDLFNQGLIARAGLDRLNMYTGESPDAFAVRVLRTMAQGTDIFLLLGGMLLPVDMEPTDWTPAVAEQTASHLKRCTSAEDKRTINAQIAAAIIGFLQAELIFGTATQRSLNPEVSESEFVRPN